MRAGTHLVARPKDRLVPGGAGPSGGRPCTATAGDAARVATPTRSDHRLPRGEAGAESRSDFLRLKFPYFLICARGGAEDNKNANSRNLELRSAKLHDRPADEQ